MEGESTSLNPSEMTTKYWTQNKVKQELVEESTHSWPNVKEEIKTEDEYFEPYEDALLEASCIQIKFEDIELKEEAIEVERKISESNLDGFSESTCSKNFSKVGNLLNANRNSELDDVFKKPEGLSSGQESKSFKCIKCEKLFSHNHHLKAHLLSVHDKLKPFKCNYCDYSFSHKGSFSLHIKSVHEKLKPFKCNYCDYLFSQKGNLKIHIKSVHDKLKPFQCNYCNYSSSQKGHLSHHIKSVHEKLKPFKCPHCDYLCGRKSNLSNHIMSVHEKVKPFKCLICDYSCSKNKYLSRHIKSVHEN